MTAAARLALTNAAQEHGWTWDRRRRAWTALTAPGTVTVVRGRITDPPSWSAIAARSYVARMETL
jgi:hypothetical protein